MPRIERVPLPKVVDVADSSNIPIISEKAHRDVLCEANALCFNDDAVAVIGPNEFAESSGPGGEAASVRNPSIQ